MRLFLSLLLVLAGSPVLYATHILGGYIQTESLAGQANAQRVTVVMYYDQAYGGSSAAAANSVRVCFGDGSVENVERTLPITLISNGRVSVNRYVINHVYSGPGVYSLSARVINRNDNMRNINDGNSLAVAFAVRTTVQVSLNNRTPALSFPPTSLTLVLNQPVSLSLTGTDTEGDSLSYALATPLTNNESDPASSRFCSNFSTVTGYQFPNDVKRTGTYRLNPRTGQLAWDVPTEQGRYVADFLVSEWRNGVLISQTQHEIMLTVIDQGGTPVTPPPYAPAQLATITATSAINREALQLTVSPNPAVNGLIQVDVASVGLTPVALQLIDGQGCVRQAVELKGDSGTYRYAFDLGNLPAGTYLIGAESNGHRVVRKVLRP